MADIEKVIKGLAHCTRPMEIGKGLNFCTDCPYTEPIGFNQFKCNSQQMMVDALELLKEQEAELSFRNAKPITHTATKLDDATCPSCGNVVGEKIRTGAIGQSVVQARWDYCRFCGQKLDWEGR